MRLAFIVIILFCYTNSTSAEIRICTQNLGNYGSYKLVNKRTKKSVDQLTEQRVALVKNFQQTKCDLIATQEVISGTAEEAEEVLKTLADDLTKLTSTEYSVLSGKSNDPLSKLGYIFRKDLFELKFSKSYSYYLLEPLTKWEKNRYFSRGPLRIDLKVKSSGENVTLLTFHFKSSAAFHNFDSSKFQFEYDRLQMAQGLYDIAQSILSTPPSETIILLGDRNSMANSASGKVLSGELNLDFFQEGICKLLKNLEASCPYSKQWEPEFISVLKQKTILQKKPNSSYKTFRLIDDILISKKDISKSKDPKDGDFKSGIVENTKVASDHPLFYLDLDI